MTKEKTKTRGWSAFATTVRFNFAAMVHRIEFVDVGAFLGDLDTDPSPLAVMVVLVTTIHEFLFFGLTKY